MTDFSEAAFRAAMYGCELSGCLGIKRIILYHAYVPAMAYAGPPEVTGPVIDDQQGYDDSMKELSLLKDRLSSMIPTGVSIDVITGDTALTKERQRQEDVDLIVMGVSGKSGLERFVLGSTTTQVLKNGELPVLIVPEDIRIGKGITSILLASDLKATDTLPAGELYKFLDAFPGQLEVINVEPEGEEKYSPQMEKAVTDLHKLLEKYNPVFNYINGDDTASAILRFAREHDSSLIIAVHQQQGFLSNMFHKSVTKKLAYSSNIPLLCLPAWKTG